MPRFYVCKKAVYIETIAVEANSPLEAVQEVWKGKGEDYMWERSHDLDTSTWDVEDENGNKVLDRET